MKKYLDLAFCYLLFKWSLMVAAIFWVLVYKLSQTQAQLPEFVYVNF